jgi:hypothetical protein
MKETFAFDDMDAGVDLLCGRLAAAGHTWGDPGLVRTFFNGDGGTPAFDKVRDQMVSNLKDAVSALRDTGEGLAVGIDSPPAEWLQIVGLLESLVAGFEEPSGDVEQILAIRDGFCDMAARLGGGRQPQEVAGDDAGPAAACRGLAEFCNTLAAEERAASVRFGWSVLFVIGTSVTMQALAAFTAAATKQGVLSVARAGVKVRDSGL